MGIRQRTPRHGAARPNARHAGVRQVQSPARGQQRQPQRPPDAPAASAGRPSGPQPRDPAPAAPPTAISAANSTARCPSGRGGLGRRARLSREAASRAGGCGPNHANHASSRRQSAVTPARSTPHASGSSDRAAGSTTTSRSRIPSSSPSRHPTVPAARHTIRCRGCGTAVLRTKTTASSTGRGHGHPPGGVTPGITTTDRRLAPIRSAAGGSHAAARTPTSRWRWSPSARSHSRIRQAARAHRAPTPRAPMPRR